MFHNDRHVLSGYNSPYYSAQDMRASAVSLLPPPPMASSGKSPSGQGSYSRTHDRHVMGGSYSHSSHYGSSPQSRSRPSSPTSKASTSAETSTTTSTGPYYNSSYISSPYNAAPTPEATETPQSPTSTSLSTTTSSMYQQHHRGASAGKL